MKINGCFLAALCFAFSVNLINGAAVFSEEFSLNSLQMETLDNMLPKDLNMTEFSAIMRSGHPHANLNVIEVIELYEYVAETHTVMTIDGYLLELHRIAGNKTSPKPNGKPAILLQHGLLCSSMDWVLAGPEKGFGFILADAGYDVWLGNARGNRYSRQHSNLTANSKKFWNFDWHEIGTRDLPAMIDHILKETRRDKLFYAGHSQGSTAFFVMASKVPEYNSKINAMFSLAPVVYCSKMYSPLFQMMAKILNFDPFNILSYFIGSGEFKPSNALFKKLSSMVCQTTSILERLCLNIMFLITGFNKEQFDMSLLPAILAHVPAGAGVNQFLHYAQLINSGNFWQFDHGRSGNLAAYGTKYPPLYNLTNVNAPVSLHYSLNDWLSDPKDVQTLYSQLPNPIGKYLVTHKKFNHLDYLWAKDVKTLLYDDILKIMTLYSN